MSTATFTQFHVLEPDGIVSGVVVALAMLVRSRAPVLTAIFLLTTVATSARGSCFILRPSASGSHRCDLARVLGVAILARTDTSSPAPCAGSMSPPQCSRVSLNVFVGVFRPFKGRILPALAPTQTEPPFAMPGIVLIAFIALVSRRRRSFRPATRGLYAVT